MSDSGLKFLLMDLELTFAIYYAYPSNREQYLSGSNIKHDQFCTCAAWKWAGEDKTYVIKITDDKKTFKKDFRNDRNIAVKLHALMEEADVIVAHNGDRFDIKHANTLFRKHGLGPIPQRKSIDTLKVAKKYFAFPGNSLDMLAKRFGGNGKNHKPNWYKMTDGDAREINTAAIYCKNDVDELEKIFIEMRPFINNYPSVRNFRTTVESCDACGSKRLINKGVQHMSGRALFRIKCNECGKEHNAKNRFIPEKTLIKNIKKCQDCSSTELHNKGIDHDGQKKYYKVKCLNCGVINHCDGPYVKNHKT